MNERPLRAICPSCTKALVVAGAGASFDDHRHPETRKKCPSTGARVMRAHLIHPCVACAALPVTVESTHAIGQEYRPPSPRPISPRSGPRTPLCATHQEAKEKAQKARQRAAARVRDRGVAEHDRDELWAAQGGACICGRTLHTAQKAPTLDHDHARARALCDHDPKKACRRCARGALCDTCNRILVGRYSATQLRMVARYIEHPTAELLGWWADEGE